MPLDLQYIFIWWITFFLAGLINLPLTILVFSKFIDAGYGLSKTLGFIIITYLVFLGSITKFFELSNPFIFSVLAGLTLLNIIIFRTNLNNFNVLLRRKLRIMIFQEILFCLGFIFWSYIRAHQPDINGLEKFMDLGFINSILRSEYLPPTDMWFSGKAINYYWFGHFWTAIVTKLSGIPSSVTFNLMLATILGLALTSTFSIVSTLIQHAKLLMNRKFIFLAGIISAILLTFAGNFHTPFYLFKDGKEKYWYPDATRFIGYNPETNDKTIHEFPIYSFVVSDLHAHLINLPYVLLYIALLYSFLSQFKAIKDWPSDQTSGSENLLVRRKDLKLREKLFTPLLGDLENKKFLNLILLGIVLGIMFMTSAWDFANYSLVTGVSIFLFILMKQKISFKSLVFPVLLSGVVILIGLITNIPFFFNFESIAQGVNFVNSRTPLWQLAILWGFPGLLTIIFSLLVADKWPKVKRADIFITSLLVSSWILIILPEIIYVKDIYIASHHRANTMFKLTYQAYVMSYLSSGYIVVRSVSSIKKIYFKLAFSLFYLIIFSLILRYPFIAIKAYYGDLKNYQGLSGDSWLKNQNPDLFKSVRWFQKNISGQPVILEAPGDSYTQYNVISSYTGLPTVSGWFVHEWLWRGSSEIPQERVTDITQIYTSEDLQVTKDLLAKYNVSFVIVGNFEREKYSNLIEEKFENLGKVVFTSLTTKIYQIN